MRRTRPNLPALLCLCTLFATACDAGGDDAATPLGGAVGETGGTPAPQTDASAGGGAEATPDAAAPVGGVVAPDATAPAPDAATPDAALPQAPADPLALAGEVRQDTLAENIEALAALGTRYTYSDGDERARDHLVERLGALGYETELDAFRFAGEDAENVIARKVGTVTPDIVYIFSAHYDSTSETPETSAPGADDNASGVAAVLEAARVLADVPLESSVWFVLTAAEEQGSVGSAHLARRLKTEHTDVRGVIAPDMIGYWPLGDDDALDLLGDMGSVALVDRMAALADALGVPYKRYIEHEYCYGDDHTNFQEAGFPAISPMDCVEAHNIPASGETLGHYHRSSDTLETLHLPFTTRVAGLIVATLADLAVPAAP